MVLKLHFFLIILLGFTIFVSYSTFTSFQIQAIEEYKDDLYYNYGRKGLPSRFKVIILLIISIITFFTFFQAFISDFFSLLRMLNLMNIFVVIIQEIGVISV